MATLATSFLIGSSLLLQVTRTTTISQMGLNFSQIRPLTVELAAPECLKNHFLCFVATLAPSFLFGSSLFLEVTRTFIRSRMSSNFDQIQPLTEGLSALECLKNQYFVLWPL